MIPIKTPEEIERMRESCRIAATVLDKLVSMVRPGISTYELDQEGKRLILEAGAESACYQYRVGKLTYPAYTCLSINEEVVHGIASLKRVLKEGDNISIDVVVRYNGYIGDNARTVTVGPVSPEMEFLVKSTEEALYHGIDFARPGNRVGDISHAIEQFLRKRKLGIVREFVGHGVGISMHEEPQIPNYGRKGTGGKLLPGMTLAIEPMVTLGSGDIYMAEDGWTAVSRDGKPAAHFEHTVLITEDGPEILTIPKK